VVAGVYLCVLLSQQNLVSMIALQLSCSRSSSKVGVVRVLSKYPTESLVLVAGVMLSLVAFSILCILLLKHFLITFRQALVVFLHDKNLKSGLWNL